MTIEELWKNLQPYMKKVDNLENEMTDVKGTVHNLENEMSDVKGTVHNLENEMSDIKGTVHNIEGEMHIVKDVNMTTMLKRQEEIREELKQEIRQMGDKLCSTIDRYIEKHEVEHKGIEYRIADLEWKNKIAN